MKRIIPKTTKVRMAIFRDWYIRDFIFLIIAFGLIALSAFSNIKYNLFVALGVFGVAVPLFLVKIEDQRLYYELFILMRFRVSKKHFSGNEMTAVEKVDKDILHFKGGYYAGVLKISPMEFFLLREELQDKYIDAFSVIFKNLTVGQKISIVKLDRPVFLDKFVDEIKGKLQKLPLTSENTRLEDARRYVLNTRKKELENVNAVNNCWYYNAFYVVVYGAKDTIVNKTLLNDVRELSVNGITATRVAGDELLAFVKRTFTQVFDERTIKLGQNVKENQKIFTPKKIKFSRKYTEIDGIREKTYIITRYPVETFNAWATSLCAMDYSKVVISATPVALDKAIKQLDRSASELEEKYNKTGKISTKTESETHYASLKYLVEELGNNNEVMLDTCISVTAYDYDRKGGEFFNEVRKQINKLGFRVNPMACRQAEAYKMATLNDALDKKQVFFQGINSSSLSASFPFVSNMIIEANGVQLGENSAPVIINFFKRDDMYKNSNIVVLGSVGGGKSFFAKTLFANLLSDKVRLFILDPEAEYLHLAENCGGKVIDMGAGGNVINPFAVLTDVSDDSDTAENLLLAHLTFLEEFFRTTLAGLGSENLELVLSLLPKLYAKHGITEKTPLKTYKGAYPTFDDFYAYIEELLKKSKSDDDKEKLGTVLMFISKFATGGRYSFLWNGQTNLQANADFVVFNFQTLLANANKTIASAQMLLLTQYLNNELIHNYNKIRVGQDVAPIVIAIDEAHVFIDPTNPVALRFMKNTAKRCRKYNGMQIVMTQSVNDFLGGVELERESKAVITESQYTFVFPLNASSAQDFLKLYDKLDITDEEANAIMDNSRGSALFIAHQRNRTIFKVVAPNNIRRLFEEKVETL